MADSQRIEDLRRRVQRDPASIAFAQLAEECRRAGHFQEAVDVCRAGLELHPGYLSARVTLGRALIELNDLDIALAELEHVLKNAPENLAAIRGVAEIHHRQGSLEKALAHYRSALALARNDPDLQRTVDELARHVEPPPPPALDEGLSFEQMQQELLQNFLPPTPPPAAPPEPPAAAWAFEAVAPDTSVAPDAEVIGEASAAVLDAGAEAGSSAAEQSVAEEVFDAPIAEEPASAGVVTDAPPLDTPAVSAQTADLSVPSDENIGGADATFVLQPAAADTAAESAVAPAPLQVEDAKEDTAGRARGLKVIAVLERWVDAIHVRRSQSRS